MAIDFFNSEKILRLTPITKETKEIADEILKGNVRVFPKLANVKVQGVSELWEMKFEASPSTYALYVYALYPLSYLLNAYELTEDKRYLDKAVSLALDFLDWEEVEKKQINKKRNKILFGDHAVSNRTQALCYLLCCLKNANCEVPEELTVALIRNGEYLADPENYSHYNHGLMMDLALLGLLNTFEKLKIEYPFHLKENLVARLQHSITRDLTEDGVHVENSPGYHFWMLGFLGKITHPLLALDKPLYLKARDALDKASEYATYITRSDGTVPAIGDTHAGVMYRPSKGLTSKYFKNADQVIFRSSDADVWAYFNSGYKTHVHKHSDNGSFNLYHKGQDIFIDPGFLNYEGGKDSFVIKSSSFHNTVVPMGKDQAIIEADLSVAKQSYKKNLSRSRIVGYTYGTEVEYALGIVADYPGVEVERLIVWIKPNIFLVFDSATPSEQDLEQVFHIAPGLIAKAGDDEVVLCSDNGHPVAKVVQYLADEYKSNSSAVSVLPAFYAKSFGVKADSQRVILRSSGRCLLTAIDLLFSDEPPVVIDSFDGALVRYKLYGSERALDLSLLKNELGVQSS